MQVQSYDIPTFQDKSHNYNTVFEPSILFIDEISWYDEDIRDEFILHLLDNLRVIEKYNNTKIYWTDEFETLMWEAPQTPPWRIDRDFALKFVPIIYDLFTKHSLRIDIPNDMETCLVTPQLDLRSVKDEVKTAFFSLMHYVLSNSEQVYLCLGITNAGDFIFNCHCHGDCRPLSISNSDDWLHYINVEESFWPSTCSITEIEKFKEAIELARTINFSGNEFKYAYSFEKSFIKQLFDERNYRSEVLYSLAKRLILDQKTASADKALNDEPIKGNKDGHRRFRVSKEIRVHYKYINDGEIIFLDYYPEGMHDRGL